MSDSALNQVMAAFERLQLENESFRQWLHELQNSTVNYTSPVEPHLSSTSTPTPFSSQPYVLELNVSLLDKWNGSRAHLRGFINQIRLIIRLQPQRHKTLFLTIRLSSSFHLCFRVSSDCVRCQLGWPSFMRPILSRPQKWCQDSSPKFSGAHIIVPGNFAVVAKSGKWTENLDQRWYPRVSHVIEQHF